MKQDLDKLEVKKIIKQGLSFFKTQFGHFMQCFLESMFTDKTKTFYVLDILS